MSRGGPFDEDIDNIRCAYGPVRVMFDPAALEKELQEVHDKIEAEKLLGPVEQLLIVPAEGDPAGLLAEGPCGSRPPMSVPNDVSGLWEVAFPTQAPEPGDALALIWDGKPLQAGCDHLARAANRPDKIITSWPRPSRPCVPWPSGLRLPWKSRWSLSEGRSPEEKSDGFGAEGLSCACCDSSRALHALLRACRR